VTLFRDPNGEEFDQRNLGTQKLPGKKTAENIKNAVSIIK
jgi:hypothetical protein